MERVNVSAESGPSPVRRTDWPAAASRSATPAAAPAPPRWAWGMLVLCTMNLFDSVDRWLLAAVLPEVRSELELSESQAGWLATVVLLAWRFRARWSAMWSTGSTGRACWRSGLRSGAWRRSRPGWAHNEQIQVARRL